MPFDIEWAAEALRRLDKLDRTVAEAILKRVTQLGERPERAGKRLHGIPLWSLRAGDYRVLYLIDTPRRCVRIVTVGHRKKVYDHA